MTGRAPCGAGCYGFATEPKVSAHAGDAPSRGAGIAPRASRDSVRTSASSPLDPLPLGAPEERAASPRWGHGNRRPAAGRLRLFVWWPLATMWRSPRGFFQAVGVFSLPRFSRAVAFLQKCAPVLPSLRGVSIKGAALRVFRTFYKPSPHILVMPVAHVFRATARGKRGEKKVLPRP